VPRAGVFWRLRIFAARHGEPLKNRSKAFNFRKSAKEIFANPAPGSWQRRYGRQLLRCGVAIDAKARCFVIYSCKMCGYWSPILRKNKDFAAALQN